MKELVIWGAGAHAAVVANIVQLQGEFEIVGFLDNINPDRKDSEYYGYPILGGEEQLDMLVKEGIKNLIFGFGDCEARMRFANIVRKKVFSFANAIHPTAIIAKVCLIGDGANIGAGVVVNPGVRIGENVILNTSCSVDHDCVIEDGVHIGPGAHLGGQVNIGEATWIGIGAIVRNKI